MRKPLWIRVCILLALLAGSVFSWLPRARVLEQVRPSADAVGAVALVYPGRLLSGEKGRFDLTVQPAAGQAGQGMVISARLELPGVRVEVEEQGAVSGPGDPVELSWNLRALQKGRHEGKLWIYSGAPQQAVLARPLTITVAGPGIAFLWVVRALLSAGTLVAGGALIFMIKSIDPNLIR